MNSPSNSNCAGSSAEVHAVFSEASKNASPVAIIGQPGPHISMIALEALARESTYIPIDSQYPVERIRYILEDSTTRTAIIDSSADAKALGEIEGLQLVRLPLELEERLTQGFDTPTEEWPVVSLEWNGHKTAYLIYTSGSTGNPKGIAISRRNLSCQMRWLRSEGFLDPSTRILQKTPIGFDAAQWEILAPINGAIPVPSPHGAFRDPHTIVQAISDYAVNTLQAVPTLLQAIADIGGFAASPSLQKVFSGGEALSWNLVDEIRSQLPSAEIVNLYGPSECTINSSAFRFGPEMIAPTDRSSTVPLGAPAADSVFYIDVGGGIRQPTPGIEGELIICGELVGMGYVNNSEETRKKFLTVNGLPSYRSGDLVRCGDDAQLRFLGRIDNQIKLRGNRIELDEINNQYLQHPWVSKAECVVVGGGEDVPQRLEAFLQLSSNAAPLMDGRGGGVHHLSKNSRLQVKAQLSNLGVRTDLGTEVESLINEAPNELVEQLEQLAFCRKSYRTFEGDKFSLEDLVQMVRVAKQESDPLHLGIGLDRDLVDAAPLASILWGISAFKDERRLLPKYGYASPGALYSIQAYVSFGKDSPHYGQTWYFDPVEKGFKWVQDDHSPSSVTRVHLVSHEAAIRSVYEKNVREVQYFELGHLLGLLDDIFENSRYCAVFSDSPPDYVDCGKLPQDLYLGSLEIVSISSSELPDSFCHAPEVFISVDDRVSGLSRGTYAENAGQFTKISDAFVEVSDVIAINQSVYRTSSFGVGLYFLDSELDLKRQYVSLGAALHRLQSHCEAFGFMSSGYSSFSGSPLPAAIKATEILKIESESKEISFYFAVGGPISKSQRLHRGMNEDQVHMEGPAEIVTREIRDQVPSYMVPDQVTVLPALPTTPNGKVDRTALMAISEQRATSLRSSSGRAPEGEVERAIARSWGQILKCEGIKATDNFFDLGGNSVRVMMLVSSLKTVFGESVTPQLIFANPVLEELASVIKNPITQSRAIKLREMDPGGGQAQSSGRVSSLMWPGLGGLPLNLSHLADNLSAGGEIIGIQAQGINERESPVASIEQVAEQDCEFAPGEGVLHLIGYSFGCRTALTSAALLEAQGRRVDSLTLLCPGNPTLSTDGHLLIPQTGERDSSVDNPEFVGMLLSVFNHPLDPHDFQKVTATAKSLDDVVEFIQKKNHAIDPDQIERIVRLVCTQYEFDYSFEEMEAYHVSCPILLVKAKGDKYSSVDEILERNILDITTIGFDADHYEILKPPHVKELGAIISDFQSNAIHV
ncbi:Tyrocidine synthase 3 [Corynebacterium glaucum]|uniref:non-ribosomal peptide synthetase n=1 Tax=Corynebacterium glaucum TaxID=187491 RepID=UPI0025B4D732|nr:AMP-binding protein [Corynebacterium glaucum]WJZ08434.1 Tyrocidine synthase 3 [Corynebacterium glaucum]